MLLEVTVIQVRSVLLLLQLHHQLLLLQLHLKVLDACYSNFVADMVDTVDTPLLLEQLLVEQILQIQ